MLAMVARVLKMAGVGLQELVMFLFALLQIVTSACSIDWPLKAVGEDMSHPIYKNINRAIIYAPGSSHAYIQPNHQDIVGV
jgi:hypothetical protein